MRVIFGKFEDVIRMVLGEEPKSFAKPVVRLENWHALVSPKGQIHLHGQAYGHPMFRDGEQVTTTPITLIDDHWAESKNTFYQLGNMGKSASA